MVKNSLRTPFCVVSLYNAMANMEGMECRTFQFLDNVVDFPTIVCNVKPLEKINRCLYCQACFITFTDKHKDHEHCRLFSPTELRLNI